MLGPPPPPAAALHVRVGRPHLGRRGPWGTRRARLERDSGARWWRPEAEQGVWLSQAVGTCVLCCGTSDEALKGSLHQRDPTRRAARGNSDEETQRREGDRTRQDLVKSGLSSKERETPLKL